MACQATRRSGIPNLEASGIRRYELLENRVMAGLNITWNENENYDEYILWVEDYSKRELILPDGFEFSSQHRSVGSPKG